MTDKPLHVRVADALGWSRFEPSQNGMWPMEWRGQPPQPIVGQPAQVVPRFDTDWSETGPLVHRYGISVVAAWTDGWEACLGDPMEDGYDAENDCAQITGEDSGEGSSPLVAVCNLILKLHAAGMLKARMSARTVFARKRPYNPETDDPDEDAMVDTLPPRKP